MAGMDDDPFARLDYEHRSAVTTYATVITQGCVCAWEEDDRVAGATMWRMTERKRHCVWHGVSGVL